jgi:putative hydrolase of the HAD superfamily
MFAGVQAVLLDLDGTLVDRDGALRAWLRRQAGLSHEIERLLALDLTDGASLAQLSAELVRLRPGLARDPGALAGRIRDELPGFIQPDREVHQALTSLVRAGIRLALISNGGPGQRRKLAAANLPEQLFATIQISGEVGAAKPDPRMFEAALAALGLRPSQTLMIGDSAREDIAGATALAIPTCWISRDRAYPSGCPTPTRTARDVQVLLGELLANR